MVTLSLICTKYKNTKSNDESVPSQHYGVDLGIIVSKLNMQRCHTFQHENFWVPFGCSGQRIHLSRAQSFTEGLL